MKIANGMIYMARRFKTATALNFLGLVVALVAFYLLATQVGYMQRYNRVTPNYERVYRVEAKMNAEAKWGPNINRPVLEIIAGMPQVEAISLMARSWALPLQVGETTMRVDAVRSTRTPFGAMQTRCVDGELDFPEGHATNTVLIPASLARTVFGTEAVAGRRICLRNDSVEVRGVYEDFPANCLMDNAVYMDMGDEAKDHHSEWSYYGYLLLHEGVDADEFSRDFSTVILRSIYQIANGDAADVSGMTDEELLEWFGRERMDFRLQPIAQTYFSGVDSQKDKGNPAMLFVLRLACILVLVIAAINFLNFVLAQSPMRIRGVNTRRVLGESIGSLRFGLVGESVLLALLACLAALGVAYVASQHPTELLKGSIALADHLGLVALMVGLSVVVGVVAGIYPAWFATSFAPALALKGSFGLTPKGKQLRTLLIGLQLFVSVLLVCYIGVLYLQSHFIYTSDYGFDKDEIFYARIFGKIMDKKDALRDELLQMSGVEAVSFSQSVLGSSDQYMSWGRGDGDHVVTFVCMPVDWHYLETMGIQVVEGRDFNEHDSGAVVINEAARRQWDWVEMGQPYIQGGETVVGVCEDVRFGSTRIDRTAEPLAFIILGENYASWGDQLNLLNIRIGANVDKVAMRHRINALLQEMGGSAEIEVRFLDQDLERVYEEEFRFIRQVLWFAFVCFVITLIGVFCLTMFETEYRRKEIGIRKVMGSSTGEILQMFCRHYVQILIVSFVLAAPVAYFVGTQWLQGFCERTPIYWWLFPLALVVVGVVTLATVVAQSWRTANENPVNSIKNE